MKTRLAERKVHRRPTPVAKPSLKSGEGVKVELSLQIDLPPSEIYRFWRQLENLPRFMSHIESVTRRGDGTSHWIVKTSRGRELEWDARIIEDKPNQMISWQSLEDADVDNAGSVWFTPKNHGRATEVKVAMKYSPTAGKLGATIARVFGDNAEQQVAEDLSRLKTLLETGGALAIRGQSTGRLND